MLAGAKTTCFILLLGAGALVSGSSPLPTEVERVLHASWRSYCRQHIQANGRVYLGAQEGEAGSETQAGALLRAVAAGDAVTFARVYAWTRINLSRRESQGDALLARRWGLEAGGAGVILEDNTDAAADLDYALALALAARRGWKPPASQPDYGAEARQVARDILRQEVVTLPSGEALLLPGTDAPRQPPYLIKPSDFSPAAFRLLSQLEPDPRWQSLHRATYSLLQRLSRQLGGMPGVGLFPDWCRLEADGRFLPQPGKSKHFNGAARQLPVRVALDRLWFGEQQAADLLGGFLVPLRPEWRGRGKLMAAYSYDGQPLAAYESPVLYAGVLAAALAADDPDLAGQMAAKIMAFYHEEGEQAYFGTPTDTQANHWAWVAMALYANLLKP